MRIAPVEIRPAAAHRIALIKFHRAVLRRATELTRRGCSQVRADWLGRQRASQEIVNRYTSHLPRDVRETMEECVAYVRFERLMGRRGGVA